MAALKTIDRRLLNALAILAIIVLLMVSFRAISASSHPSLSIVKTASLATYNAVGDVIDYSYLVTNDGFVTISGPITIDDDRPTDESCPAGDLAPGGNLTCTASHTITQGDLDAGSVTNIATATGKDPGNNDVTSPTNAETVTADQNPSIGLVKTGTLNDGGDGVANAGDTISYAFTVTNTGNVARTNLLVHEY